MKSVNVILAFHAQEPSWDLPARVLESLRDEDLRRESVPNGNWVRSRAEAGRDIYDDLLELGAKLDAPLCLEATNEVLMQVRREMPETFARLGQAYRAGALYPIYGNAFHTHIAMITDNELADELRLNREYLRDALGAPEPRHAGAFPMEGSIDAHKLQGFVRAGMEYVIFPNISPKKMHYRWDEQEEGRGRGGGADVPQAALEESPGRPPASRIDEHGNLNIYTAFTIGDGLLALPRHFPISQEIWRPITKWQQHRLTPQGYMLGKYAVLDEEYRSGHSVQFPITRQQAVDEYAQTLRAAIDEAPDGALLLYIQDLELMDFGEEALEILGETWTRVRSEGRADVRFVTPDQYLDGVSTQLFREGGGRREEGRNASSTLHPPSSIFSGSSRLRFDKASWAPEIRLCLRSDGHYPPLHAGPHRGIDADEEIFRRWPFIFWEPGRFIADTFRSLLESFGTPLEIPLSGAELEGAVADFSRDLDPLARLAIHLRAMQRACNFGWQPDEARHKWPYMHGVAICEILRGDLSPRPPLHQAGEGENRSENPSGSFRPLPERAVRGLDRVLEILIDTRIAYLRRGIERLGDRAGDSAARLASEGHLRNAELRRARASAMARQLRAENTKFITNCAIDARAFGRMLALLQEHCKETFLAINELQRAWMRIDDTTGMIEEMYAYLYDLYPPLFPQILRDLASDDEMTNIDQPALL